MWRAGCGATGRAPPTARAVAGRGGAAARPLLADPRRLELAARLIRDRHWSPERIEGRIMIERPDLGVSGTTVLRGGPQRPGGPRSRRAQQG